MSHDEGSRGPGSDLAVIEIWIFKQSNLAVCLSRLGVT